MHEIQERAKVTTASPKGILAADESTGSAEKRLAEYGISGGEAMRRNFRELFLTAPGAERFLTGVILYEETLTQTARDGRSFVSLLSERGIMPGIKVDTGTEPFSENSDELVTKGLEGLSERLAVYRAQGALFTKWRAVIRIDENRLPTEDAITENARRLGEYARLVQEAGMVPMLEPEVLLEGNHSIARSEEVLTHTLKETCAAAKKAGADLSALIIKTSMALSGSASGVKDSPADVATYTLRALRASVPEEVPGIVFLSGGQSTDQATENLAEIRTLGKDAPWTLTFSYARALQDEALRAWGGQDENIGEAQSVFLERLRKVSEAGNE